MSEETPPHPEDPYGIAKLAVEQDLRARRDMFGLRYVDLPAAQRLRARQNIGDPLPQRRRHLHEPDPAGRPMTIFGDGTQTRAFSYVDDVAPVMAEAIEHDAAWDQVFNVGADRPFTLNELAAAVARAMGVEPRRGAPAGPLRSAGRPFDARADRGGVRRAAGDHAWRMGCGGWRRGRGRTARVRARRSRGSKWRGTCRSTWRTR